MLEESGSDADVDTQGDRRSRCFYARDSGLELSLSLMDTFRRGTGHTSTVQISWQLSI